MAQYEVHTIAVAVPDPAGDDKQLFLAKVPLDANGGGITILEAYAVNGAATSGGTTFTYQLLTYSGAGTPAVNGTINTTALGGTTDYWAASVPKAFTIATAFVDAGYWIVLDYQEIAAGNPTNSNINIKYVMGK